VLRIKFKHFSPERPLSNVFSSNWTVITALQKITLQHTNFDWNIDIRPRCGFIFFLK